MARGMKLVIAALLLAGCPGEPPLRTCPADETCSAVTNGSLVFHGVEVAGAAGGGNVFPTLVGGTQDISIEFGGEPFTRAYEVDDTTGAAVAFDSSEGAVVHVHGVAAGSNYLRIVDPSSKELYGRVELEARGLGGIYVVPANLETYDNNQPHVWLAVHQAMTIALNDPYRSVDTSMDVIAEGATRTGWDGLDYAELTEGHHEVTVTAGGGEPMTIDVDAVAAADTIEPSPEITFTAGSRSSFFFYARNAGRSVMGADWSFTSDNGTIEVAGCANCVYITPATAGTMHVTASAAGATYTGTYPVRAIP